VLVWRVPPFAPPNAAPRAMPLSAVARRRLTTTAAALSVFVVLATPAALAAQQARPSVPGLTQSGPLIQSGGRSVQVDDATFKFPDAHVFKAVYVIDRADSVEANQQLTTIARFLNLHARHSIPKERLLAAAVVHGTGWMSLLSDSAYGARFPGKTNPSKRLVEELLANNVQLVLCGQTAGFRGVKREELLPGVQLGLSAMTALNVFQSQGYQFNPW
jgi:intracellular sulfur oxidation DsrE/DsrF family protein